MPLPTKLFEEPEETAVVGDVDAFIQYVENGQAEQDWYMLIELYRQELDEMGRLCEELT